MSDEKRDLRYAEPIERHGELAQNLPVAGASPRQCLMLDHLAANPKLARRLPASVAWRYHALPLAESRGRVTVAMADPQDAAAREAVVTALGAEACLVQGDRAAIDSLLAQAWGAQDGNTLRLEVVSGCQPLPAGVWAYAQALGELLGARLERSTRDKAQGEASETDSAGPSLFILAEPDAALLRRMLGLGASGKSGSAAQDVPSCAVLSAWLPRWPLRRILLVLWGAGTDEEAVDWAVRLAQPSASTVTVLAVVPPVPAMYGQRAGDAEGLHGLLASDTRLGRQMRRAAKRMVDSEVESTLRLRQGPPEWQIFREMVQGEYDLLVLPAMPRRWWQRLEGDLTETLFRRADRPTLVTGAKAA